MCHGVSRHIWEYPFQEKGILQTEYCPLCFTRLYLCFGFLGHEASIHFRVPFWLQRSESLRATFNRRMATTKCWVNVKRLTNRAKYFEKGQPGTPGGKIAGKSELFFDFLAAESEKVKKQKNPEN